MIRFGHRPARLLAGLAVSTALILAGVGTAWAHAVLESSNPERGAVLKAGPGEVRFNFNEPIEASFGAVRVFDTEGSEVQSSQIPPGTDGKSIGARLPERLQDGFYTATFKALSADSHPISGGITFSIDRPGEGAAAPGSSGKTISELLADSSSGAVTRAAFWFDRWIGFLALALAVGSVAWFLLVWRPSRPLRPVVGPDLGRRIAWILGLAAGLGLVSALAAVIFQGAIASGKGFFEAFGGGIPGEVMKTRFGLFTAIRAAAFLCLVPLAVTAAAGGLDHQDRRLRTLTLLACAASVVLVFTPGLSGHAATQSPTWLLLPSDVIHAAAMAIWAGGLAAMLWLLPVATGSAEKEERTGILLSGLRRFSTVAMVAIVAIAATGTTQAVIEVGSFSALTDTAFGRAVSIKVFLFIGLITLGGVNRNRVIPALATRFADRNTPGPAGVSARRNLRLETVLVTIVLAVTAALVSYPPPNSIGAGPASGSISSAGQQIEYTLDPARVGSNEMHVYLFDERSGAPVEIRSLAVEFSPPGSGDTPIEADVSKAGPGHYVVPAAPLAIRGEWMVTLTIRSSRFEERVEHFRVQIR